MAWVSIGGHRYYRRSKRVGVRVVTEHVGSGPLAEREADRDARDRLHRQTVAERGPAE